MRVAGLPGADFRSVNEVFGFVYRLSTQSGQHMTDYIVDAGTVAMFGGANETQLLKFCLRVGLLTKVKVDGLVAYKIIDDPDFINLRLRAEVEWERQQRKDTADVRLTVPIRARDGDLCRYCAVMVQWRGRTSPNKATFDHLNPGEPATTDTMVVACKSCNSELRDASGLERVTLRPQPAEPYYSEFTAEWLSKNGRPTRPSSQLDTAPSNTDHETPVAIQQPAGHRTEAASDPAAAGPRAENNARAPARPKSFQVTPEMSSAGTGRVGSGRDLSRSSNPPNAAVKRKRSRRGTGTTP